MRKISLFLFLFICALKVNAQKSNPVPQSEMEKIYQEVKTPYKYGLVLVPNDEQHKMDCP
ncbi:MAG: glycosylase, partial [Pedobacter sp.]